MVWLIESGTIRKRHGDVKNTQLGDKEETRVAWMIQSAVFAWVHFLSEREHWDGCVLRAFCRQTQWWRQRKPERRIMSVLIYDSCQQEKDHNWKTPPSVIGFSSTMGMFGPVDFRKSTAFKHTLTSLLKLSTNNVQQWTDFWKKFIILSFYLKHFQPSFISFCD